MIERSFVRSHWLPRSAWNLSVQTGSFLRRPMARLIFGLVFAGLLLRLTVLDQFHPWALIYYITPIPAVPIWLAIAGLLWGKDSKPTKPHRRFSVTRVNRIAIGAFAFWAFQSEFVEQAQPRRTEDLQVVFWNTARVPFGVGCVARQIRSWNSPVVGLVEANTYYPETKERWLRELPDYQIATTHFGGLIAIKGTVNKQTWHSLLPSSWCEQFDVTVNDHDFTILLVDISAQLNLSRRQPLLELAKLAGDLADRPLLIMGDFNTPDDSVLLDPLRNHCQLAFRERGTGYAATWPMPLPVLTLDQVWINEKISVSRAQYQWSLYSDHRPQICHISIDRQSTSSD